MNDSKTPAILLLNKVKIKGLVAKDNN